MDLRMQNHRMTRWLGRFVAALLLVLCATASPAQAAVESVAPKSGGTVWYNNWGSGGPFASADAACRAPGTCPVCGSLTYVGTIPNPNVPGDMNCLFFYNPGGGAAGWNTLSGTAIPYSNAVCPVPTVNPAVPYTYNPVTGMCERPEQCPANSSGTFPNACTCNAGYEPDPTKTSCVPVSTCTIDDLPPITDPDVLAFENNPNTSDTARLTTEMKAALKCLTDGATALGCTPAPSVGSAFRPPAYNQHLIDVWDKWVKKLKPNKDAACAARKAKIHAHFQRHGLLESQPPVPNSRHTRGLAVDVSIDLPAANIDSLARGCGLRRPLPVDDPVHFQFP